jgi:hypothetical protein
MNFVYRLLTILSILKFKLNTMNVFVGKIGKSILFKRDAWGPVGGDNEAPLYYENLFHRNPSIQFYLFGISDYSRLSEQERQRINRNGNVHDIWDKWKDFIKTYTGEKTACRFQYMEAWTKNAAARGLVMDAGVLFAGPNATTNIPGKVTKMKTPDILAQPLEMLALYAGPLVSYLNDYRVPYMLVVNDPRFFPFMAKDILHPPARVLSQYNETITYKHRKSYTDNTVVTFPVKSTYAAVETIYLIDDQSKKQEAQQVSLEGFFGETPEVPKTPERDIKFQIVLNEGRPSRYELLKSNVLDHIQDVAIYGQWTPRVIGADPRFKGSLPYHELQKQLPRIKYTYCIPIKKGWATAKIWEMINNGVVPFLHHTYDSQNNIGAPEFLRVKDSKDLQSKIEFLEANPAQYHALVEQLKQMIKPHHRDGSMLNQLFLKELSELVTCK